MISFLCKPVFRLQLQSCSYSQNHLNQNWINPAEIHLRTCFGLLKCLRPYTSTSVFSTYPTLAVRQKERPLAQMAPSNKSLEAGQVQLEKNSTLFLLSSFSTAVGDRALHSEATWLFLQTFMLLSGKQLLDVKRVMRSIRLPPPGSHTLTRDT